MISSSVHQRAWAEDEGGGDFAVLSFVADGGGVGEDTGLRRGVSGISRGAAAFPSNCVLIERGPSELCGGVTGALNFWLGREIRGLKAAEPKRGLAIGKSNCGVSANSKPLRCPATFVLGLPPFDWSCSTMGRLGRFVVRSREGEGASIVKESSTCLFRFGVWYKEVGSCISIVESANDRDRLRSRS